MRKTVKPITLTLGIQPTYDRGTSGKVALVANMRLMTGWDLIEYAKMRYNLLGNAGHWFAGLHARYLDDFDLAKSIEQSPFAEQIPVWLREAHELLYAAPQKRASES